MANNRENNLSNMFAKYLDDTQPANNKVFEELGHKIIVKTTQPVRDKKLWKIVMQSKMQKKVYKFIVDFCTNNEQTRIKFGNSQEALGEVLMQEVVDAITREASLEASSQKR